MIVELAGLPRSGKTSSIEVARDYFRRSGRVVRAVAEGARSCPFDSQHRVELACWVANQALSAVLEAKYGGAQETLLLQDRGLFDALAFLKLLQLEGRLSDERFSAFASYFAISRWAALVDLVILLKIQPERAIERDLAAQLDTGPAVITNRATLENLATAYNFILKRFGDRFSRVECVDVTGLTQLETAKRVISTISSIDQK